MTTVFTPYPKLPIACDYRGADMGRPDVISNPDNFIVFHIYKMPMVDGVYDSGGAYWGDGDPMWHVYEYGTEHRNEMFIRAPDPRQVKSYVTKKVFPKASFVPDEIFGMSLLDETERLRFESAYVDCALWSSTDEEGEPMDISFGRMNFAPEAEAQVVQDCQAFLSAARETLDLDIIPGWDANQAGHDFWLTRNGHGAGFWGHYLHNLLLDGVGTTLTNLAKSFGTIELYVGDDGKVHHA